MPAPRTDPITEQTAVNLYVSERLSSEAVGRRLGLSPQGIRKILLRNGVSLRPAGKFNTPRLCADCDKPAVFKSIRCPYHRWLQRRLIRNNAHKAWRERRKFLANGN